MNDKPLPFPANVPLPLKELITRCCRKESNERPCIFEVINKTPNQVSTSNQIHHRSSNSDIERAVAHANVANENRIVGLQQQLDQSSAERDQIAKEQQKAELNGDRTENQTLQKRIEELSRNLEAAKVEISKLKKVNAPQPVNNVSKPIRRPAVSHQP
ncbi:hypothetical protein P9112_010590 [Eukaryota sp. TZLM1-RC]